MLPKCRLSHFINYKTLRIRPESLITESGAARNYPYIALQMNDTVPLHSIHRAIARSGLSEAYIRAFIELFRRIQSGSVVDPKVVDCEEYLEEASKYTRFEYIGDQIETNVTRGHGIDDGLVKFSHQIDEYCGRFRRSLMDTERAAIEEAFAKHGLTRENLNVNDVTKLTNALEVSVSAHQVLVEVYGVVYPPISKRQEEIMKSEYRALQRKIDLLRAELNFKSNPCSAMRLLLHLRRVGVVIDENMFKLPITPASKRKATEILNRASEGCGWKPVLQY